MRSGAPFKLDKFFKHCGEIGLELLNEDKAFIRRNIRILSHHRIKPLLVNYILRWQEAQKKEENENRKQNAGRFAANTWLRENIE